MERTRPVRTKTKITPGSGGGGPFGQDPLAPATATVIHGVHAEEVTANRSVGEIRRRMHDRLALGPNAQAFLEGRPVGDDVCVIPGQTLTFMRHAGEKGSTDRAIPPHHRQE